MLCDTLLQYAADQQTMATSRSYFTGVVYTLLLSTVLVLYGTLRYTPSTDCSTCPLQHLW